MTISLRHVSTYFTIPRFLLFLLTSSSSASQRRLQPRFRLCPKSSSSSCSSFSSFSSENASISTTGGDVCCGEAGTVTRRIRLGRFYCERGGVCRGEVGGGARRTRAGRHCHCEDWWNNDIRKQVKFNCDAHDACHTIRGM